MTPAEEEETAGGTAPGAGTGDFPEDCDYNTDVADVWVYDSALKPLNMINMILCYMAQTAAGQMINEGNYNALIDASLADEGGSQDTDAGQSSGSNEPEYQMWVVNSTRTSDTSPQHVKVWVPDDDPEDDWDQVIRVKTVVTEGVTEENPFGQFTLNFAGIDPDGGSVLDPMMHGTLMTNDPLSGSVGFSFFENQGDVDEVQAPGDYSHRVRVNVQMNADQSEGEAKILQQERFNRGEGDSGLISNEYLIAFNDQYFLRQIDGGDEVVFSRTDYEEMAWRYVLYNADGEDIGNRVDLESGFGFRTENDDYGHIGYWGMWLPPGVTVEDGDTVFRDVYGEDTEGESYTLVKSPGRLIKHERNTIDVADVEDDPFRWWEWDPIGEEGHEYIIVYSGGLWLRIFEVDWETGDKIEIDPPTVIDTETIGYLNMWSDSLGGPAAWVHDDPLFVTYFAKTFVNASDDLFTSASTATLLGFVDCLRSELTAEEVEMGDIFMGHAPDLGTPHEFVFSSDDLTLYYDPTGTGDPLLQVGLAPGEIPTEGPNLWGMHSGPLVTDTAGLTDIWEVWNADVFYSYETGHNTWNWYVGLLDAFEEPVVFDPPIQFTYTHSTANDRNGDATYDGKTFFLDYGGPGDLWGLPEDGVDLNDDGSPDRWYPVVSLADGVLLGPTGTEYVVKAMEIEQALQEDPSGDGELDIVDASNLVLPDASDYAAPTIGDKPVVDEPPRVIAGEVVGDDDD